MKTAAILGCGPAGLLAAFAAEKNGLEVSIFSKKVKSEIPGSVYLHERIIGLTPYYCQNMVQYVRLGTAEGYARKVYGDASRPTGWEHYFQSYESWNAVEVYDNLWNEYEARINDRLVDGEEINWMLSAFDCVISTLPAKTICYKKEHVFNGAPYWIKRLPVPPLDADHDVVVYNGLPGDAWYRWSVLGGLCSIESTVDLWPGDQTVVSGIKATNTDCDCWPGLIRAGRWAEWRHGVLLNDAYKTALVETGRIVDGE